MYSSGQTLPNHTLIRIKWPVGGPQCKHTTSVKSMRWSVKFGRKILRDYEDDYNVCGGSCSSWEDSSHKWGIHSANLVRFSEASSSSYFPTESSSCVQNRYYAALQTDGSNSPSPFLGPLSVIGKNFSKNYQIWPPVRKTNGHRCSFPFYRLFMSCKFLLQKSGARSFMF